MHVLSIAGKVSAFNETHAFHGLHGRKSGGLHHASEVAQLFLSESISDPKNPQKSPVSKGHAKRNQSVLERPHLSASHISYEVGKSIVGNRLAPVFKQCLGVFGFYV